MASTILTLLEQASGCASSGAQRVTTRDLLRNSSSSPPVANECNVEIEADWIKGTYLLHRANLRHMQQTGIPGTFPFAQDFPNDLQMLSVEICTQRAKLDTWYTNAKQALYAEPEPESEPEAMESESEEAAAEQDDEPDVFLLDMQETPPTMENGPRVSAWLGPCLRDQTHFILRETPFRQMDIVLCPGDTYFRHDHHIVMRVLEPNVDYYMRSNGVLAMHTDDSTPGVIIYRLGFERSCSSCPVLYCNDLSKLTAAFVTWLKTIKCPWEPSSGAKPNVSRFFNLTNQYPAFGVRGQINLTKT